MRGRETFEHEFVQNKFKTIEMGIKWNVRIVGGKRRRGGGGIKGLRAVVRENARCDIVGMWRRQLQM